MVQADCPLVPVEVESISAMEVGLVGLVDLVEVDLLVEAVVALGSLASLVLVPCFPVPLREPPLRSFWASHTIVEYKEVPREQR
jgi:hypothetical protein